jgi:NAD(P)-dependent dehydrogenase (short-subunit alcohol dehydrogenase family)
MMTQFNYQKKIVLISGASSGFGQLAAQAFASSGATLALLDISADGLAKTKSSLNTDVPKPLLLQCDISDAKQVAQSIKRLVDKFGRLDIAINNAGVIHPLNRIADCDEQAFDKTIDINLKGTFLMMKYQLQQMLKQGCGRILNTASVSGLIGSPFLGGYAAAKHGVIGLTRSAAIEYGRKGININALCPTFAETPMLTQMAQEKGDNFKDKLAGGIPMQRLVEKQEVVDSMLWLCSDENSYMNGAAVTLDGGLTAG